MSSKLVFNRKVPILLQVERFVKASKSGNGYVSGRISGLPKEWVGKKVKIKEVKEHVSIYHVKWKEKP